MPYATTRMLSFFFLLTCCLHQLRCDVDVQPHIPSDPLSSTKRQQQQESLQGHTASCIFSALYKIPCVVSGFSDEKNHSLELTITTSLVQQNSRDDEIVDVYDDFCSVKNSLISSTSTGSLAIAARGKCSFVEKVRVAQHLGYKALLLVNSDDDLFVAGGGDDASDLYIPLFLVARSFSAYLKIDQMNGKIGDELSSVHLQFSGAKTKRYEFQEVGSVQILGIFLLTALITYSMGVSSPVSSSTFKNKNMNSMQKCHYAISSLIVMLSFTLRLGTLRVSSPYGSGHNKFNHNETDERIYHTLVDAVIQNVFDYRLDADTIWRFQLSPENYSDSIFIHPPMFTYISAFLHNTMDIPLAIVSVIYHLVTCVCLVFIVSSIDITTTRDSGMAHGRIGMTALQLFVFCPIAFFCSQKFWIDNCAMMMTCIATLIHIKLVKNVRTGNLLYISCMNHLFSGILYGVLALNTKLTNLALVPFLLAYSCIHYLKKTLPLNRQSILRVSYHLFILFICFFVGMVAGYGPWLLLYYSRTGRWMPNAWPSQKMIENSVYLQEALNRPFYHYMTVISKISPTHTFGCCLLLMNLFGSVWKMVHKMTNDKSCNLLSTDSEVLHNLEYWILFLWPFGFLLGYTLVGMRGGGYQTRFILPILPATSIITAIGVEKFREASPIVYTLIAIGCMHLMFYGIMFYPMFADFEFNVFDVITTILSSPQHALNSHESYQQAFKFMRHFGLSRKLAGE